MALEYPRDMLERLVAEQKLRISAAELEAISLLVDTVFFASLVIEEAEPVRIAIVHDAEGAAGLAKVVDGSPDNGEHPPPAWDVTEIPRKAFDVPTLAKLSRGIRYGSQLAVVGGTGRELWIDGVARIRRRTDGGASIRIAAPRPGVLVFERHMSQVLRFEGGQQARPPIDVIGRGGPVRRAIGKITGEQEDTKSEATHIDGHTFYSHPEAALRRLIQRMRATASGALLALLPQEPDEDVLRDVTYKRVDPLLLSKRIQADKDLTWDAILKRIATHDEDLNREQVQARDAAQDAADVAGEELDAAIDDVAQLSAIDGAVLGGPRLAIYGAGYHVPLLPLPAGAIRRALDARGEQHEAYPARHGTRHAAGFSFAYHNPGAVVFVVSEDGPVSCALRVRNHVLVWPVEVLET